MTSTINPRKKRIPSGLITPHHKARSSHLVFFRTTRIELEFSSSENGNFKKRLLLLPSS